jgi:Peptidase S24-like
MSVHAKNLLTMDNTACAPRTSWTAERSGLVADALRLGGRLRLRVYGESMLPTLWPGDVVEIASCSPDDIRPGEIVLARRDGRLFLHRLVTPCTSSGFTLRGDSMPGPDLRFSAEALLGRLVGSTDDGRDFSAGPLFRTLGLVFCYFGMARRLALKIHRRRETSALKFRGSESTVELGI